MDNDIQELPITDSKLQAIAEELRAREPIFHHPELGVDRINLEQQTAENFWEVGASGRPYSRKFVIDAVERRFRDNTEVTTDDWKMSEFYCRELGPDTYMITYLLNQGGRLSRRLTLWRRAGDVWQILYHQGTLIAEKE